MRRRFNQSLSLNLHFLDTKSFQPGWLEIFSNRSGHTFTQQIQNGSNFWSLLPIGTSDELNRSILCLEDISHSISRLFILTLGRSTKMRHIIPLNTSAALSGASLILLSSIRDASARLVTSSDLREQVMESKSFAKVKGDECFMLEAGTPNKEDVANIDIGILGCGEALTCLEDESSSTGARCVEFEEVGCKNYGWACDQDSDCCSNRGLLCKKYSDYSPKRCVCVLKGKGEECQDGSECCSGGCDTTGPNTKKVCI